MKALLFLFLISIAFPSNAQKIRFSDPRNRWSTTGRNPDSEYGNNFSYLTDTFVYMHNYKRFHKTWWCMGAPYWGDANDILIREDTLSRKVYYIFSQDDTVERILYDYNLNVGDTIQYKLMSGGFLVDSVVSVDSTLINGIYHKVFTLKCRNRNRAYSFVEGIGTTVNPELPIYFGGCFEYDERLKCFQQYFQPAFTAPYHLCGLEIYGIYFLDSFYNCQPDGVDYKVELNNQAEVVPNPVKNELVISRSVAINSVSISNIVGQVVFSREYNMNKVMVNVSYLPAGVYFIKINNSIVRKFTKE